MDMGPSAIRVARLNQRLTDLGCEVEDLGNVVVEQPESSPVGHERARYMPQIAHACERLAEGVEGILLRDMFPLVLGGDHAVAAGTVGGVSRHFRQRHEKIGLVWIDAHADMNTPETSPSGNVHGMPLAACMGLGAPELIRFAGFSPLVEPRNVALVGIRDVDQLEKPHVRESGVNAFTMRHVDEQGMRKVMEQAIAAASNGATGIHVSLDIDSVDPRDAPGVGTPVRGGLTYREAHLAMEMLGDTGLMTSLETVEVNPILDEGNRTALLAVELIMSAMGKRIL